MSAWELWLLNFTHRWRMYHLVRCAGCPYFVTNDGEVIPYDALLRGPLS